jgi:glutamyl-tRNA synthetase
MNETIRTRFAPSPTGHVHIGNMRVAIYNWLVARHHGGAFLLRLEDTDRERSTPEAVRTVLDALDWLGLDLDEEAIYQSARQPAHLDAAESLLARGLAYRADKGGTGKGEAVLLRMPDQEMTFQDEIKGPLRKPAGDLEDFVIVRSNGTPVFHLANVLDDIEMRVTHVIRGDDHIENTYRHIALYQALEAPVPRFAHLPMIVNPQGRPYSKRDGDAYVGDFRENGFLPEALFNYMVLLGWSPGDDREVLSREEIVSLFSLDRVKSSPAQMDAKKLEWMNGEYIRALPPGEFLDACRAALAASPVPADGIETNYLDRVCTLMQERTKRVADFPGQAVYFFTEDFPYDKKAVRKRLCKEGVAEGLAALTVRYAALDPFDEASTEEALRALAEERGAGAGALVHPVRVAVSGQAGGPGLFEMLALLGRDRVVARMERALEKCTLPAEEKDTPAA